MSKDFQLLESINLIATISCSKCDKEDESSCFDIDEAIKEFYSAGWRATENYTYCRKCAKKFLRKKVTHQ